MSLLFKLINGKCSLVHRQFQPVCNLPCPFLHVLTAVFGFHKMHYYNTLLHQYFLLAYTVSVEGPGEVP